MGECCYWSVVQNGGHMSYHDYKNKGVRGRGYNMNMKIHILQDGCNSGI